MSELSWATMECGCRIRVESMSRFDVVRDINLGTHITSARMLESCQQHTGEVQPDLDDDCRC